MDIYPDKLPVKKTEALRPPKDIRKIYTNFKSVLKILKSITGIEIKDMLKKINQNFTTSE